jgi:hypothetical protein
VKHSISCGDRHAVTDRLIEHAGREEPNRARGRIDFNNAERLPRSRVVDEWRVMQYAQVTCGPIRGAFRGTSGQDDQNRGERA